MTIPANNPENDRGLTSTATEQLLRRYNVHVQGEGEETLLFCNGLGCSQEIWQYLTPRLRTRYQLVLFDYPGTGNAQPDAYDAQRHSTLQGYVEDIIAICQALQLQRIILVGHSVGASIALVTAAYAPTLVSSVVLLAPSPCYLNEPGYYGGFERVDVDQLLSLMEQDYDGWASLLASLLIGSQNPATLGEQLNGFFCQADHLITKNLARLTFYTDVRPVVPNVRMPTLILQCQQDVAAPEEVGAYLSRHLPQGTLVIMQATGHCPHLSAPLETLAAIEAFLG
ncbi:alpha/beta fold hydrolase [Hymenobacter profundi]|uniref:Alpha/beta hydrolase n=1 Tax=Hymenobacter profundi TaxID=1982110 RepID=A0ABS6WXA4_9BACT|nr:alpha/beta hydrolase [Hymenobacter profundi]MBW3128223.1 alpha/beta hydrolase [Hymenobacter profundi]